MIVMRNDHISFVVNKKTFFFSDHSFEKLYRQNNDRDIVNLSKIFIENPLRLDPHEKIFFVSKRNNINQRTNSQRGFLKMFFVLKK